jgi:hypothetical protein
MVEDACPFHISLTGRHLREVTGSSTSIQPCQLQLLLESLECWAYEWLRR